MKRSCYPILQLLMVCVSGMPSLLPAASTARVREEIIAQVDPAVTQLWAVSVPTGSADQIAWPQKTRTSEGKFQVLANGRIEGVHGHVFDISFSDDGNHMAVHEQQGGHSELSLDGKLVSTKTDFSMAIFSSKNELVYAEHRNKKWYLMVDGKERSSVAGPIHRIAFNTAGEVAAFESEIKDMFLWTVHGAPGTPFKEVGRLVFSKDGRFAYAAVNDRHKGTVVVDGKPTGEYGTDKSFYSIDGKNVLLEASHTIPDITLGGSDGHRAFIVSTHGVGDPVFSPDGKRLAYAVHRGKGDETVIVDGVAGPSFESVISGPFFSQDGAHFGYVAGKDRGRKMLEVVDHSIKRETDVQDWNELGDVAAAPDLSRFAFVTSKQGRFGFGSQPEKRRVTVDGRERDEGTCWEINALQFSFDGRHVAYAVVGGGQRPMIDSRWQRMTGADGYFQVPYLISEPGYVVIDGQPTKEYDDILPASLSFIDNSTFRYVARDGDRFLRVTVELDQPNPVQ